MKVLRIYFSILPFILIFSSCSPDLPIVPPINSIPTGESHPGKFIWRDLMTDDIPSVKKFYSELFGWTYIDTGESDNEFTVVLYDGKPIAGMFRLRDVEQKHRYSQWISYLSVADMDQAINYTKASGGRIYNDPFELPNRGTVAYVFDSQNSVFAFVKSSSGDPADQDPVYNQWFWTELWTNDVQNSVKFYTELFGYNQRTFNTRAENQYHVLEKENRPRAGVIKIPFENVNPHWMPYIAVKDPSEIVKKVKQLGGTVYLGTEGIAGNNAAIIADPSGAVFTIQKWPLEKGEFKEIKDEE
ncbi:MAG: VOC family protein [Ignavibacteriaceae bacterium]|nr:VOC family protein [Ignavibacteriaceae bacterium]